MKKYQAPKSEKVENLMDSFVGGLQYALGNNTVDATNCGGQVLVFVNGKEEICQNTGNPEMVPVAGDQIHYRCEETGTTDYMLTIASVVDGSMSCSQGYSPLIYSYESDVPFPLYCTATIAIYQQGFWVGIDWCAT